MSKQTNYPVYHQKRPYCREFKTTLMSDKNAKNLRSVTKTQEILPTGTEESPANGNRAENKWIKQIIVVWSRKIWKPDHWQVHIRHGMQRRLIKKSSAVPYRYLKAVQGRNVGQAFQTYINATLILNGDRTIRNQRSAVPKTTPYEERNRSLEFARLGYCYHLSPVGVIRENVGLFDQGLGHVCFRPAKRLFTQPAK